MNYIDRLRQAAKSVAGTAIVDAEVTRRDSTPAPAAATDLTETQRVVALPTADYAGADLNAELRCEGGSHKLREIQSAALLAIRENRGGFFPIGVGHGKSWIALLAATVLDCTAAVILAPASTVAQLHRTYHELRDHFDVVPPTILSYAQLSQPKGTSILRELAEKFGADRMVLVADEAHRLKRLESARTKRVIRFLNANPSVSFVALSGTMISKTLRDFSHLAEMALRERAPVPVDNHHLEAWCNCIDVQGRPSRHDWMFVKSLVSWAGSDIDLVRGQERRSIVRKAYQKRLRTSAGVVASTEGSLGCSLLLNMRDELTVPDTILDLIGGIEDGVDPAGEPIADDATSWRVTRYIVQGFFYRWVWGEEGEDLEWLEARRGWGRECRYELARSSHEGYDSPFLVASRIQREINKDRGGRAIHRAWQRWCQQKHKPAPPVEAVWVDDYLIQDALAWANRQSEPVILWCDSQAVQDKLAEHMPVFGAGAEVPTEAITCAMSIQAHGVGKNLQAWRNQLIISPPSSGKTWEQLLGRLHRQGQLADEVECVVYAHAPAFTNAIASAMDDARMIEDATGNRQKLIFATVGEDNG